MHAATLAEASAAKTAAAAKRIVETTIADLADADSESSIADVAEVAAREGYRSASARAAARVDPER